MRSPRSICANRLPRSCVALSQHIDRSRQSSGRWVLCGRPAKMNIVGAGPKGVVLAPQSGAPNYHGLTSPNVHA